MSEISIPVADTYLAWIKACLEMYMDAVDSFPTDIQDFADPEKVDEVEALWADWQADERYPNEVPEEYV